MKIKIICHGHICPYKMAKFSPIRKKKIEEGQDREKYITINR